MTIEAIDPAVPPAVFPSARVEPIRCEAARTVAAPLGILLRMCAFLVNGVPEAKGAASLQQNTAPTAIEYDHAVVLGSDLRGERVGSS